VILAVIPGPSTKAGPSRHWWTEPTTHNYDPLIKIDPFRIGQDFVIISNQFSDRFREIRK